MPIGPVIEDFKLTFAIAGGAIVADTLLNVSELFNQTAGSAFRTIAAVEQMKLSTEALLASEYVATGQARSINEAREKSVGVAQELFEWNRRLAIQSPLEAKDIADATSLAQAYGFLAGRTQSVSIAQDTGIVTAQRLTAAMTDFVAGTGKSGGVMGNLITQLGQIQASGKASGEELRTLSEWGLPIRRYLAEGLGVTTAQIVEMQGAGQLLADDVIPAIVLGMEREFGGSAARAGETLAGLGASLADLERLSLQYIFGPSIEMGKAYYTDVVAALGSEEALGAFETLGHGLAAVSSVIETFADEALTLLVAQMVGFSAASSVLKRPIFNTLIMGLNSVSAAALNAKNAMVAFVSTHRYELWGTAVTASVLYAAQSIWSFYNSVKSSTEQLIDHNAAGREYLDIQERIANVTIEPDSEDSEFVDEQMRKIKPHQENLEHVTFWEGAQLSFLKGLDNSLNTLTGLRRFQMELLLPEDMEYLSSAVAGGEDFDFYGENYPKSMEKINTALASLRVSMVDLDEWLAEMERDQRAEITATERSRKEANEIKARRADRSAYYKEERALMVEYFNSVRDIEQEHGQKLQEIEEDIARQRTEAKEQLNADLLDIEKQRQENIAAERERFAEQLLSIAESAAEAAQQALADAVGGDVDFIRDAEERLAAYNDKRETLHAQGALKCSQAELEELIEQEEQAARSYADQEAELEQHLGRKLIAYTQAQALIYGVNQRAVDRMVQGIALEFGVMETASQRSFGEMRQNIDQWAQRGGAGTEEVIASFRALRGEAVETEMAYERLMDQRSGELAQRFIEGSISEADYRSQLQTLAGRVRQELGLGIDQTAYETQAVTAQEDHQQKLVDIERDANEQRTDAYQSWAEEDERLRGEYRDEQLAAEEERYRAELELAQEAYADQLKEKQAAHELLEAQDIEHLREARLNYAKLYAGIDDDLNAELDQINADLAAGLIEDDEALRRMEEAVMNAETLRRRYESRAPEDIRKVAPGSHPTTPQHAPSDEELIAEQEKEDRRLREEQAGRDAQREWERAKDRVGFSGGMALDMPQRRVAGGAVYVTSNVNIHNPVLDTPDREAKVLAQVESKTRQVMTMWTDDLMLRGKIG